MVEYNSETTSNSSKGDINEIIGTLDQAHITQENVSKFYNEIGADGYDEWAKHVKFNEPENIVDLIGEDKVVKV